MDTTSIMATVRSLAAKHKSDNGDHTGFFMLDATRALGGLANASNALALLMVQGLVESEPVYVDGEVHTLYRLVEETLPSFH